MDKRLNSSQENNFGCGFLVLVLFVTTSLIYFVSLSSSRPFKFREAEAKSYLGAMNRVQQAYYLENSTFANSIARLDLGIKSVTDNYTYLLNSTSKSSFHYAIPHNKGYVYTKNYFGPFQWRSKLITPLKTYISAVFVIPPTKDGVKTAAILCMASSAAASNLLPKPTYKDGKLACGIGTTEISRSAI